MSLGTALLVLDLLDKRPHLPELTVPCDDLSLSSSCVQPCHPSRCCLFRIFQGCRQGLASSRCASLSLVVLLAAAWTDAAPCLRTQYQLNKQRPSKTAVAPANSSGEERWQCVTFTRDLVQLHPLICSRCFLTDDGNPLDLIFRAVV